MTGLIIPVMLYRSSHSTEYPWAHNYSGIAVAPARSDVVRVGELLDLCITRTDAPKQSMGVKVPVDMVSSRTRAKEFGGQIQGRGATECMATSALARHGRSYQ